MKLLLVLPTPPDPGGHGAIPVLLDALVAGLTARHDVTIAVPAGPDSAEIDRVATLRDQGVDIHSSPRHLGDGVARWQRRTRMATRWARGFEPWRTTWFAEPSLQSVIDELVARRRFDAIAVEDNAMAGYRYPHGIARILTEHEVRMPRAVDWHLGPLRQWPSRAFGELDWRRWSRYQIASWSRFDRVQVFTNRDRDVATGLAPDLGERFAVAPFGVRVPDLQPDIRHAPGVIAFLGDYSHQPNVHAAQWLATVIMPLVREQEPTARLRLGGPNPPLTLRALAGEHVEVVGSVVDSDAFMRRAAIVAAPVNSGGGMRMKVLHAMALGMPVVTTTRGAQGLSALGDPPLVIADDAAAVAAAIVRTLRDPTSASKLGRRARTFVEVNFSPTSYAHRVEQVYEQAIAAHARTAGTWT